MASFYDKNTKGHIVFYTQESLDDYFEQKKKAFITQLITEIEHKFYGANDPKVKDIIILLKNKQKEL